MRTDRLLVNHLSPAATAWYLGYLAAVDGRDLDAYAAYLADEVTLAVNGGPPAAGKAAVVATLAAFWPTFAGLEHDLKGLYGRDDAFALEADNHYLRLDGRRVTVAAVAFTERDARGLVTAVRLFGDTTPVFAPRA